MTLRALLVGPRGHGGEEVYVRSLVENPPVGVEYTQAGDFHQGAEGAPCRVVEEVLLNRLLHPRMIPDMGFRALALRAHFDLVHVHAHPVRLSGLGDVPLVMSEGSSSAVYLREYLDWDEERVARAYARARRTYRALRIHDRLLNLDRVARVYVFSRWARDINVRWGADPSKIDVVAPGWPTPAIVDRSGRSTFTFLFVGTDFERKGGFEVVEAFDSLASRHAEVRLILVTADPSVRNPDRAQHEWVPEARRAPALRRLAAMEAAGRIVRHPLLSQQRLYREMYPAADAFVMPSHAEGFGFTNVEALSFGLPVVSARVGAIPEVVEDGRTGLLVAPGNVEALSLAMEGLATDPSLWARMGEAARASFLARFTIDRFRSEVGRVYRSALEGRCAAS
jgi:glycosyltransferase involved in cell wall biosynthesis